MPISLINEINLAIKELIKDLPKIGHLPFEIVHRPTKVYGALKEELILAHTAKLGYVFEAVEAINH